MLQGKAVKKKQNFEKVEEKQKLQQKKPSAKKKNYLKFSRQAQSKISNLTFAKANFVVPSLNLIKFNGLKLQKSAQSEQQNFSYQNKKIQIPETKDAQTSNQQTERFFQNYQSELEISPSIQNRYANSPIQALLKSKSSKVESDSFITEADKQQLLLLEIKHLKHENTFLKKKIRDLKKQLNGGFFPEEFQKKSSFSKQKQSPVKKVKKGFQKINIESLHLSVNLFFEEIKNLLNSVTSLFKIQFTKEEVKQFQQLHSEQKILKQLNEEICPLKRHEILKKFYLKRKLEKLSFEEQEKKFDLLLTIFTEYYTFKEQSEKKVVETIDQMVMYTSDLNRWLIKKAHTNKVKSELQSQKSSSKQVIQKVSPPKFDYLRTPPNPANYLRKGRGSTLSPNLKTKANS